ncbi:ABC transporter ATP-binding protein [Streptomyces sp. NPDC050560]|uniref:ABC transporter ATP-binding protein n=1 Tax=Streptomyces sp. NPDC050560 TaxID=3365630 RepID=UPI0037AB885C
MARRTKGTPANGAPVECAPVECAPVECAPAGNAGNGPGGVTTWQVMRRMATRFRPYRLQAAGSLVMVLLTVALGTAGPLLLQRVIDVALPRRDIGLLSLLCGLMIGCGLLASLLAVAENALTNWTGQRVAAALRVDVYDHARAQRLRFYTEQGRAQIQTRLVSDVDGVDRFLTGTVHQVLSAVTALLVAGTAMAVLSWPLALVCLVLALLLSLLNNRFARRRRDLARRRQRLLTTVLRYVAEDLSLAGVLLGRTLRVTHRQRERFVTISDEIRKVTFDQRIAGISALTVIGTSFACVPPLVYWAYGTFTPHASVGAVVVLVMLQTRLSQPIQSLLRLSGGFQTSVAMFERVLEYVDMEPAEDLDAVERGGARRGAPGDPAGVALRGVGCRYPGALTPALDGVDLDFAPGSVTVVTGATGSGKSTLGLVLAGLLGPGQGTVRLDPGPYGTRETTEGAEGADAPVGLRGAVTLVPQHTALRHGTVRDNLLIARDTATDAELDAAVAVAQLTPTIAALGHGYDTPVGEDGLQLSGGERQRLGLARALLADCRMLVVDEVTSSLDRHTADRLNTALRAHCRDRTLVIVAHRLPRLEPADRVVVLDHGRVVESGSHAELAAADGAYAALIAAGNAQAPRPAAAVALPRAAAPLAHATDTPEGGPA